MLAALKHGAVAALTVVVAVAGMQVLLALAPGDPIDLLPNAEAVRATLEAQWGLDVPLWERIGRTLIGDFGQSLSLRPGAPVREVIAQPLLKTASWWLAGSALLTGLAAVGAVVQRRSIRVPRAVLMVVSIVPTFLLAHLIVNGANEGVVAATDAGLISRPSWFPLPLDASTLRFVVAVGILAIGSASLLDAYTELSTQVHALRSRPFAIAAHSRGEPERSWLWRHLAIAVCELLAGRAPALLGGLVIVEKVLLLGGAGTVLWDAAVGRDYPVALALTAVFALWVAGLRAVLYTLRDHWRRGQTA